MLGALGPPAGRRPHRHGLRRRGGHHAPGGLDQPQGRLLPARAARITSRSCRRPCSGRSRPPASTSSSASPSTTCSCSWARSASRASCPGRRCCPIGTLYDPFVTRGLDALYHALYCGRALHRGGDAVGRDALAGGRRAPVGHHPGHRRRAARHRATSSRRSRARSSGSCSTGSRASRPSGDGESLYLRLSTARSTRRWRPPPTPELPRARCSRGGYRLIDARGRAGLGSRGDAVHLFAAGVMVPEAVAAARALRERRRPRERVRRHQPRPALSRAARAAAVPRRRSWAPTRRACPSSRCSTVTRTRSPSSGGALGVPQLALGVDDFGQSGRAAISIATTGSTPPPSSRAARRSWPRQRYNSGIPMSTLPPIRKPTLRREMEALLGPGAVLSEPDELLVYESDGLTLFRALADFVVFPTIRRARLGRRQARQPRGHALRRPRRRHRALGRLPSGRGRPRDLADADEPRARGGLRQPDRRGRAGAGQPAPLVGGRAAGLLLRARSVEPAGLHHRRQHREQLRRPAHAQVRRDDQPRARPRGGAARRRDHVARRQDARAAGLRPRRPLRRAPRAPSASPPRSSSAS